MPEEGLELLPEVLSSVHGRVHRLESERPGEIDEHHP